MPSAWTHSGRRILASWAASVDDDGGPRRGDGADLERAHRDAPKIAVEARRRYEVRVAMARGARDEVKARAAIGARGGVAARPAEIALVEQPEARERDVLVLGKSARHEGQ